MTARRRSTWMIHSLFSLAATLGSLTSLVGCGSRSGPETTAKATPPDAKSPLATLAEGIRRSDEASLAALANRLNEPVDAAPKPIPDAEAADWITIVSALRGGFLSFEGANGRATTISVVSRIFDRFAVETAPASWVQLLAPARDLITSALADPHPDVRALALSAIGRNWHWYPGRTMLPIEEQALAEWKDSFHPVVLRKLADRDPRTRASAVMCLSMVPIDALAAPAVAYIDDPHSGQVRHQVLVSFAARRTLLTEDMIIKRLQDPEPGVPQVAELILKTRGLNANHLALARLITSPKPELRASVIPLLADRDDLDPVVWLIRLSHDDDELVRSKAVEAMTGKTAPEVRERLREMAAKDRSATVRALASKLVATPGESETTVALPPLPGSPSLTPKAN